MGGGGWGTLVRKSGARGEGFLGVVHPSHYLQNQTNFGSVGGVVGAGHHNSLKAWDVLELEIRKCTRKCVSHGGGGEYRVRGARGRVLLGRAHGVGCVGGGEMG